jgi:hypothetical protein
MLSYETARYNQIRHSESNRLAMQLNDLIRLQYTSFRVTVGLPQDGLIPTCETFAKRSLYPASFIPVSRLPVFGTLLA